MSRTRSSNGVMAMGVILVGRRAACRRLLRSSPRRFPVVHGDAASSTRPPGVAVSFWFRLGGLWPDILVPQLRIAVEYDDAGRSRRAHLGFKEASDVDKDDALREVGRDVIRIRAGGLDVLGPHSVVSRTLTADAVDEVVGLMRRIRGDAAVDAIALENPEAS